jgi:hypothetical protein
LGPKAGGSAEGTTGDFCHHFFQLPKTWGTGGPYTCGATLDHPLVIFGKGKAASRVRPVSHTRIRPGEVVPFSPGVIFLELP